MPKAYIHTEKIRKFNRFYTQQIGLLNQSLLKSGYSLSESRILFELDQHPNISASDLVITLDMDPAYLSRILEKFKNNGLIRKKTSPKDSRKHLLRLTHEGREAYAGLRELSNRQVLSLISSLGSEDQDRLVGCMEIIEHLLRGETGQDFMFTIRSHKPGDIGYITYRHAIFYSREYGFDESFDVYVADGTSKFIQHHNPEKERLWIVESGSEFAGSVAIVKKDMNTAQLRWLLVEARFRGKGVGGKLVEEAVDFSRQKGYERIILWTFDDLKPARRLYARAGFEIAERKTHKIWGRNLTEEKWELRLP